jgi:hypothetical protein
MLPVESVVDGLSSVLSAAAYHHVMLLSRDMKSAGAHMLTTKQLPALLIDTIGQSGPLCQGGSGCYWTGSAAW